MSKKSDNQVKETPQQRAMVELAINQVADYKKRWLPVQKNLAESITEMGAAGSRERKQAQGMATTETEARFSKARRGLESNLASTAGLGSSRSKLAITGLAEDQATSAGLGRTLADQQIDDAYTAGLNTIMQIGQGQKADAITGMGNVASMSGRRAAADAEAALANRAGNAELIGGAAGAGLGLLGTPQGRGRGVSGTNDFSGVTGNNSMDMWSRFGAGGD